MSKKNILVSGDSDLLATKVKDSLAGLQNIETCSVGELRSATKKMTPDLLVLCLESESSSLKDMVQEVRKTNDSVPVFVVCQTNDIDFAVFALKLGVADFFSHQYDTKKFQDRVERESRLYQLTQKIFMTGGTSGVSHFEDMIGGSRIMQENFKMIQAVAKSNATVLITGESGVGKELVAKAVHRSSERAKNKFVDINCGAIPRDLLENELFGHEKGSFTGAHKRYIGSFETAHMGTLFLDEISEMDVLLQVKLLRALQERTITRIGSSEAVKIDVRIVAATNRNLQKSIQEGRFREDLYYRLNVVNIDLPSLRERREDIPLLAKHFLDYYSAKNDKIFLDFENDALEALINYDWPGNVRELENTIERIVVLNDSSRVQIKHLPNQIQKVDCLIGFSPEKKDIVTESQIVPLEDLEKQAIEAALIKFKGNIPVTAKKLRIGQATLYRKVKKFGLQFS